MRDKVQIMRLKYRFILHVSLYSSSFKNSDVIFWYSSNLTVLVNMQNVSLFTFVPDWQSNNLTVNIVKQWHKFIESRVTFFSLHLIQKKFYDISTGDEQKLLRDSSANTFSYIFYSLDWLKQVSIKYIENCSNDFNLYTYNEVCK